GAGTRPRAGPPPPTAPAAAGARARGPGAARPRRAGRARAGAAAPPRGSGRRCRSGRRSSCQLVSEDVGEPHQRGPRARLHGPERDPEELRDLALGEPAPVGERDHLALPFVQLLEGTVHTPRHPALLGEVARAWLPRRL